MKRITDKQMIDWLAGVYHPPLGYGISVDDLEGIYYLAGTKKQSLRQAIIAAIKASRRKP